MTIRRAFAVALIAGAGSVALAGAASAQSVQEAQQRVFACMQKANQMKVEDDKKQDFIDKCIEESEKSDQGNRKPT